MSTNTELADVIIKQQQEIAGLKAMVNEFIEEFSCFVAQHECNCGHPSCRTCKECKDAFKLLDKTPQQCLANVKADAISEMIGAMPSSGFNSEREKNNWIGDYIHELQEQK